MTHTFPLNWLMASSFPSIVLTLISYKESGTVFPPPNKAIVRIEERRGADTLAVWQRVVLTTYWRIERCKDTDFISLGIIFCFRCIYFDMESMGLDQGHFGSIPGWTERSPNLKISHLYLIVLCMACACGVLEIDIVEPIPV